MIWFTLLNGESIAIMPSHVRYIRPADEDGGTTIHFSKDDRFTVAHTPTEVVTKLEAALGIG